MGKQLDEFCSDAGEPNGSAGIFIQNVLKRNQIVNIVIFVIRYFGGTKLGVPRLIHAFGAAAERVIENATLIPWLDKKRLLITYSYELEGIMRSIMKNYQVIVIHEGFCEKIDIQLRLTKNMLTNSLIALMSSFLAVPKSSWMSEKYISL